MRTIFTTLWSRTLITLVLMCYATTIYLQPLRIATLGPDIIMRGNPIALGLEAVNRKIEVELERQKTFLAGMELYNQSKWIETVTTFTAYINDYRFPSAEYEAAIFLKAKTLMNLGSYKEAYENFDLYLRQGCEDTQLKSQAEFYRATMLMNIDKSLGLSYLKVISEDHSNYYQAEANALYHSVNNSY